MTGLPSCYQSSYLIGTEYHHAQAKEESLPLPLVTSLTSLYPVVRSSGTQLVLALAVLLVICLSVLAFPAVSSVHRPFSVVNSVRVTTTSAGVALDCPSSQRPTLLVFALSTNAR